MGMTIQDAWANANIGNDTAEAPERIWAMPKNAHTSADWRSGDWNMLQAKSPMCTEYIRADIKPKVNPLVWEYNSWDNEIVADAYLIGIDSDDGECVLFTCWVDEGVPYKSLDAAKAAAQADYERRILSALV